MFPNYKYHRCQLEYRLYPMQHILNIADIFCIPWIKFMFTNYYKYVSSAIKMAVTLTIAISLVIAILYSNIIAPLSLHNDGAIRKWRYNTFDIYVALLCTIFVANTTISPKFWVNGWWNIYLRIQFINSITLALNTVSQKLTPAAIVQHCNSIFCWLSIHTQIKL